MSLISITGGKLPQDRQFVEINFAYFVGYGHWEDSRANKGEIHWSDEEEEVWRGGKEGSGGWGNGCHHLSDLICELVAINFVGLFC